MGKFSADLKAYNLATVSAPPTPSGLQYLAPNATGTAFNGLPIWTVDQAAANLNRSGAIWNVGPNGVITYSFLDVAPTGQYHNPHETFLGGYAAGYSPFTAEQRVAAAASLALWDDLIAPRFVEKNGVGSDITFLNTSTGPAQASTELPFYNGGHGRYAKVQGDLFVNNEQGDNFDLYFGGYGQTTLTHELGHALGLSHPGDYNFSDDNDGDGVPDPITYGGDAYFFQDSQQYTIMSYFDASNTGALGFVNWATGGYYQTPQTPMIHDIAAVQAMYGADTTTRTGDTVYGFNSTADRAVFDFTVNKNPFLSIYDAGGHDTLDLSGFTGSFAVLDLRPGAFSTGFSYGDTAQLNALWGTNFTDAQWHSIYDGRTSNPGFLTENIGIAYNTIIEDGKTGAGNDTLIGNDVANRLDGGAGNDVFTGNGGNDTFVFKNTGGTDRITDFSRGHDKIDLSGIDASTTHGGNDAFTFIGDAAFSGVAGQAHTYVSGGVNFLSGDVNGDGVADFVINLGTVHVNSTDILL